MRESNVRTKRYVIPLLLRDFTSDFCLLSFPKVTRNLKICTFGGGSTLGGPLYFLCVWAGTRRLCSQT